jgi:hypothetical protein
MIYLYQQNFKSFVLTITLLSISSFCSSFAELIMTQSLTKCYGNDVVVFELDPTNSIIKLEGKQNQWYLFFSNL